MLVSILGGAAGFVIGDPIVAIASGAAGPMIDYILQGAGRYVSAEMLRSADAPDSWGQNVRRVRERSGDSDGAP